MFIRAITTSTLMIFAASVGPGMGQEGPPLLVVNSKGVEHTLHLDALDSMEQVEFTTTTIWTEGEVRFSGVPVISILEALDAQGETLRMSALNDYAVEMPTADLEADAPIVATRMNGQTMPVREKGPYWIVYPFDRSPEYRTEAKHAQSVWQLKSLAVTD